MSFRDLPYRFFGSSAAGPEQHVGVEVDVGVAEQLCDVPHEHGDEEQAYDEAVDELSEADGAEAEKRGPAELKPEVPDEPQGRGHDERGGDVGGDEGASEGGDSAVAGEEEVRGAGREADDGEVGEEGHDTDVEEVALGGVGCRSKLFSAAGAELVVCVCARIGLVLAWDFIDVAVEEQADEGRMGEAGVEDGEEDCDDLVGEDVLGCSDDAGEDEGVREGPSVGPREAEYGGVLAAAHDLEVGA